MTAVQRFGSAMNLNVHFHTLALDAPVETELARLLTSIRSRVLSLLRRRGLLPEPTDDPDAPDSFSSPSLAACTAASLVHRVALGPSSGQPIMRRRPNERAKPCTIPKEGCVEVDGFSLHDHALRVRPMTFLERLAALVPPPRAHLVVDHGVLASAAAVVRSRNYSWAELMKRVFLFDVLQCPCGGSRRRIATIMEAGRRRPDPAVPWPPRILSRSRSTRSDPVRVIPAAGVSLPRAPPRPRVPGLLLHVAAATLTAFRALAVQIRPPTMASFGPSRPPSSTGSPPPPPRGGLEPAVDSPMRCIDCP